MLRNLFIIMLAVGFLFVLDFTTAQDANAVGCNPDNPRICDLQGNIINHPFLRGIS